MLQAKTTGEGFSDVWCDVHRYISVTGFVIKPVINVTGSAKRLTYTVVLLTGEI